MLINRSFELNIENQKVTVYIKNNFHNRCLRLTVRRDKTVLLTIPKRASLTAAYRFIDSHKTWIARQINQLANLPALPQANDSHYLQHKKQSLDLVKRKIQVFNNYYNFKVKKITIRNQKSLWGSCSRNGNLSFSYKILFLADELQNYLIVHELVHLSNFDHSAQFWKQVSQTIPNYLILRSNLRKISPLSLN